MTKATTTKATNANNLIFPLVASTENAKEVANFIMTKCYGEIICGFTVRLGTFPNAAQVAEDLFQDALLCMFGMINRGLSLRFESEGALHGYLLRAMANRLRNENKAHRNAKNGGEEGQKKALLVACYSELSELQEAKAEAIRAAMAELDPLTREILTLFGQGYKETEIARMLGIPVGTVKTRKMRGFQKIKDMLGVAV